jgi:hypothetical protein
MPLHDKNTFHTAKNISSPQKFSSRREAAGHNQKTRRVNRK